MKRSRLFTAICLMAATLLTACTQDELAEQGNTLPEGQYPLQIGSVTMSVESSERPWTRVSENADGSGSVWDKDETEQIGVRVGSTGNIGTYTINTDGSATAATGQEAYWPNTGSGQTVNAWYPAYTGTSGTVDLSDQSDNLAYVLKGTGTGNYDTPVTLTFTHQLAKVRVNIERTENQTEITNVEINNYTECTNTQGTVTADQTGWIKMHNLGSDAWEANVVPGAVDGNGLLRLNDTGSDNGTTVDITGITEFVTGSKHEITVSLAETIDGCTIIPFTHTITLNEGTSLTSEMISTALDGTGTLVINGNLNVNDQNPWFSYSKSGQIKDLTLTDVESITGSSFFAIMSSFTVLNLPNATNIEGYTLNFLTNLTDLKLTSEKEISFSSDAITSNIAGRTTLTLNENKRDEVTNGNQWSGRTWKEIVFE